MLFPQRSKSKCKDFKKAFHLCNGKENNLIIQGADMQEHIFMLPPEVVKEPWVRGLGGGGAVPEGAIEVLQDTRPRGTSSGKPVIMVHYRDPGSLWLTCQ